MARIDEVATTLFRFGAFPTSPLQFNHSSSGMRNRCCSMPVTNPCLESCERHLPSCSILQESGRSASATLNRMNAEPSTTG